MALFCKYSRATRDALRGRFIQTLTDKIIPIQPMRGQGCDRAAKDYHGSN